MTLNYSTDERIKDIITVLDEYSGWFMQVLRCLFYPEQPDASANLVLPESFRRWLKEAQGAGLPKDMIIKLNTLHGELTKEANSLVEQAGKSKAPPSYESYNHLVVLFEEFSSHVRRVEKDILLEDSGIDTLTGLRNMSAFKKDFAREMARLARQGRQFSVALVRIDGIEEMKTAHPEAYTHNYLKYVAGMIKESVRTFDDAYRMLNDEFILLLKQADISGSIKAMNRLKEHLMHEGATYEMKGQSRSLTLSSCIAEPVVGDEVERLLADLQTDLDKCVRSEGTVLEYYEMSPLQRLINQEQD